MATCKDCICYSGCSGILNDFGMRLNPAREVCDRFEDRSRFVELPLPISEGDKLHYIFEDIDGKIKAGKDRETVTRVCKDGFYVSGRIDSDGTYRYGDDFYPWEAIGTEYFFTLEEAEAALKERESNG